MTILWPAEETDLIATKLEGALMPSGRPDVAYIQAAIEQAFEQQLDLEADYIVETYREEPETAL